MQPVFGQGGFCIQSHNQPHSNTDRTGTPHMRKQKKKEEKTCYTSQFLPPLRPTTRRAFVIYIPPNLLYLKKKVSLSISSHAQSRRFSYKYIYGWRLAQPFIITRRFLPSSTWIPNPRSVQQRYIRFGKWKLTPPYLISEVSSPTSQPTSFWPPLTADHRAQGLTDLVLEVGLIGVGIS